MKVEKFGQCPECKRKGIYTRSIQVERELHILTCRYCHRQFTRSAYTARIANVILIEPAICARCGEPVDNHIGGRERGLCMTITGDLLEKLKQLDVLPVLAA